jgi:amino acid transporter
MTLYGALLRCYPRDFRGEYGDDMTQLLALQLRDENAVRVWVRTFVDLALTVPSLRLEAVMSRRRALPDPAVLYGSAAVACLVFTAVAGSSYVLGTAGLLLAVLFASLAVVSWRRARALGTGSEIYLHWWKYLVVGVVGIAGCVLVANVGDQNLPGNTWFIWIIALLTSMVLSAVGLLLGLSMAFARRRPARS